jgi:hypothetical protein
MSMKKTEIDFSGGLLGLAFLPVAGGSLAGEPKNL